MPFFIYNNIFLFDKKLINIIIYNYNNELCELSRLGTCCFEE